MADIFDNISTEIRSTPGRKSGADIFDAVASRQIDVFDRVSRVPDILTPEMEEMAYEKYKSSVVQKPGRRVMGFSQKDFVKQPGMTKEWAGLVAQPRTHFEKLAESAKRGKEVFDLDQRYFDAAMFGTEDPEAVFKQRQLFNARQQLDPIEGKNLLEKMEYGTANILPGMIEGTKQSIPHMTIGAMAGIPAGPAGVAGGLAIGWKTGSAYAWYRQGAGEIMMNMKEKGITGNVQKTIGGIAGVPYALIEQMQWAHVTPGLRQGVNQAVNKSLSRYAAKVVTKYGVTLATETTEEVMQEGIAIIAEDLADFFEKNKVPFNREGLMERAGRLKDTAIQSVIAMALLPVPGAVIDIHGAKAFINPDTPGAVPNIVATTTIKNEVETDESILPEQKEIVLKYVGDIETKIVKETVDKFPDPIFDQESAQAAVRGIAAELNMSPELFTVDWQPGRKYVKRGTSWAAMNTLTKVISIAPDSRHATGEMGHFYVGRGKFVDVPNKTPGKINQDLLKKVLVHELAHITAPPRWTRGGTRQVHHSEFNKWVKEGVTKLTEVKEKREAALKSEVFGPIGPSGFNFTATQVSVGAHNKQGGSTIDILTGQPIAQGYAVSVKKEFEKILPTDKITEQDIETYKAEHAAFLRKHPEATVGTWVDDGKSYIDISLVVPTEEQAMELAKKNNQIAIFDLSSMETIQVEKKEAEQGGGKIFTGPAYRFEAGTERRPEAKTAADVVRFEQEELGNTDMGVSSEKMKELEKRPASDVVWVTRTREAAARYSDQREDIAGEPTADDMENVQDYTDVVRGGEVISEIGPDGVLVLKPSPQAKPGVEYKTKKPKTISRRTALKLGHKYPESLGMTEQQRKDFNKSVTGKESMKQMTAVERTKLVEAFEEELRSKGLAGKITEGRKTAEEKVQKLIVGDQLVNFNEILDEATDIAEKLPERRKLKGKITQAKARWGEGMAMGAYDFFLGADNDHVSSLAFALSGGKENAITRILHDNKQFGIQRQASIYRGGVEMIRRLNKEAGITNEDLAEMSRSNDPRLEMIKTAREVAGKAKTKYHDVKIGDKTFTVSMGQLIDVYLMSNQEAGMKHLNKSGLFLNGSFTGPMDVDAVKALTDYVTMDAKAMAVANNMIAVATEHNAPAINLVSNRMDGKDLANEKNYHHLEVKTSRKLKGKGVLNVSLLENKGLLKPRQHTGKGALIVRDAFDRFVAVQAAVAEYVGMAEPLRAMNTLLNYEPFAATIDKQGYKKVRNNIIEITERAQDVRREGGYPVRALGAILRGAYRAVLIFNPRVIGSQYMSTIQYAGLVDPKYLTNIGQGLNGANIKEVLEHNDVAWTRFHMSHQSLEMAELGQLDATLRVFVNKSGDINKAGIALKLSDIAALTDGYNIAKAIVEDTTKLEKGSDAYWNKVNAVAEDLWLWSQPSWDKWNRSVNTSNPTVLRQTIFLFRSYYEKALSMLHRADSVYSGSEKTEKDKAQWARVYGSVLTSQAMTAILRTFISWGVWRQRKDIWDFLADMLAAPAGMIPVLGKFLGNVMKRVVRILAKQKPGYRPEAVEVLPVSVLNIALRGTSQMTEAAAYFISGDTKAAEKQMKYATRNIIEGIGTMRGIPVGQLRSMEKGWTEGEAESTRGKRL